MACGEESRFAFAPACADCPLACFPHQKMDDDNTDSQLNGRLRLPDMNLRTAKLAHGREAIRKMAFLSPGNKAQSELWSQIQAQQVLDA